MIDPTRTHRLNARAALFNKYGDPQLSYARTQSDWKREQHLSSTREEARRYSRALLRVIDAPAGQAMAVLNESYPHPAELLSKLCEQEPRTLYDTAARHVAANVYAELRIYR